MSVNFVVFLAERKFAVVALEGKKVDCVTSRVGTLAPDGKNMSVAFLDRIRGRG